MEPTEPMKFKDHGAYFFIGEPFTRSEQFQDLFFRLSLPSDY